MLKNVFYTRVHLITYTKMTTENDKSYALVVLLFSRHELSSFTFLFATREVPFPLIFFLHNFPAVFVVWFPISPFNLI